MIHEQAEHVKQSCKPSHDKNDVQRFNDGVVLHEVKSNVSGRMGFLGYVVNFLDEEKSWYDLIYFRVVCHISTSRRSEKRYE